MKVTGADCSSSWTSMQSSHPALSTLSLCNFLTSTLEHSETARNGRGFGHYLKRHRYCTTDRKVNVFELWVYRRGETGS